MAEPNHQITIDTACVVRFVAFGALMGFANVVPYLLTRGASGFDGVEVVGWPFSCYRIGGNPSVFGFSPWALLGDIFVAVMVSGLATWIFRDGIRKTLLRWKRWGTPHAE